MSTSLEGNLSDRPLPGLLFGLHRQQLTGILTVGSGGHERQIYLRNGLVVAVITPSAIETCARILLDMGIVSQDRYARSLMLAHETGRTQTEVLEELGAVTEQQVIDAVRQQEYEAMMRLFRLRRAEFAVRNAEHEHGRSAVSTGPFSAHPRRIIRQGIRAAYDLERLHQEMGNGNDATFRIDVRNKSILTDYGFDPDAERIVAQLCDGDCTLEMLGASELEARRILYTLMATDALEVGVGASPVEPRVATPVPATSETAGPGSYRLSRRTVPPESRRERLISRNPPPTAVQDLPSAAALRERIEKTAKALEQLDYFELLGVKRNARPDQIAAAYERQARAFDPTQLRLLGLDALSETVGRILDRLQRAHDILSNATMRDAYVRAMSGGDLRSRVRRTTSETDG